MSRIFAVLTRCCLFPALRLYPNPAGESFHFEYALPVTEVYWKLNDLSGRVILADNLHHRLSGKFSGNVNVSMLPPGMYHFILQGAGKITSAMLCIVPD